MSSCALPRLPFLSFAVLFLRLYRDEQTGPSGPRRAVRLVRTECRLEKNEAPWRHYSK